MDRRHRILLRGVHTPVENGRHRVRVQREGRGQLRGLCAHLLVYILQLDHIRLLYGQRRYVTRRLNVGATKSRASGQMREGELMKKKKNHKRSNAFARMTADKLKWKFNDKRYERHKPIPVYVSP